MVLRNTLGKPLQIVLNGITNKIKPLFLTTLPTQKYIVQLILIMYPHSIPFVELSLLNLELPNLILTKVEPDFATPNVIFKGPIQVLGNGMLMETHLFHNYYVRLGGGGAKLFLCPISSDR